MKWVNMLNSSQFTRTRYRNLILDITNLIYVIKRREIDSPKSKSFQEKTLQWILAQKSGILKKIFFYIFCIGKAVFPLSIKYHFINNTT